MMRQVQQLPLEWVSPYENLANYLLALHRLDDARQTIREARERRLDDIILHNALYGLAFLARNSSPSRPIPSSNCVASSTSG
jgi:hypothetical protein